MKKLRISMLKKTKISRYMFALLLLGSLIAPVHMLGTTKNSANAVQEIEQVADQAVDKESKKSLLVFAREKLVAFKENISTLQAVAILTATVVGLYELVQFFSENNKNIVDPAPAPAFPQPKPSPKPEPTPARKSTLAPLPVLMSASNIPIDILRKYFDYEIIQAAHCISLSQSEAPKPALSRAAAEQEVILSKGELRLKKLLKNQIECERSYCKQIPQKNIINLYKEMARSLGLLAVRYDTIQRKYPSPYCPNSYCANIYREFRDTITEEVRHIDWRIKREELRLQKE